MTVLEQGQPCLEGEFRPGELSVVLRQLAHHQRSDRWVGELRLGLVADVPDQLMKARVDAVVGVAHERRRPVAQPRLRKLREVRIGQMLVDHPPEGPIVVVEGAVGALTVSAQARPDRAARPSSKGARITNRRRWEMIIEGVDPDASQEWCHRFG